MPEATPQVRVWSIALEHLRKVSDAFKSRGEMSKSMTAIASEAILTIPMPNGSKPAADHGEESKE
jgi:hypothetical protein